MSIDRVSENVETPFGQIKEPKSGGKKWLFAGCGCVTLLAVICIGGGVFLWMQFGKPVLDFINENTTYVQSSEEVQELLGTPVTTGAPEFNQSVENGAQVLDLRVPVSGPKGSGTMVLRGKNVGGTGSWTREELYIEMDGKRVDLDPDATFKLDIDEGK